MDEFESEWKPESTGGYSRKLVEFCSAKALTVLCQNMEEKINDGSFSRFTFDMMVAWEMPSSADEEASTVLELFPLSLSNLFYSPLLCCSDLIR